MSSVCVDVLCRVLMIKLKTQPREASCVCVCRKCDQFDYLKCEFCLLRLMVALLSLGDLVIKYTNKREGARSIYCLIRIQEIVQQKKRRVVSPNLEMALSHNIRSGTPSDHHSRPFRRGNGPLGRLRCRHCSDIRLIALRFKSIFGNSSSVISLLIWTPQFFFFMRAKLVLRCF